MSSKEKTHHLDPADMQYSSMEDRVLRLRAIASMAEAAKGRQLAKHFRPPPVITSAQVRVIGFTIVS